MCYGTALRVSTTCQRVMCSRPTAIIKLALSDLKPRAVPLSHAADITRYNEVVYEKS